MDTNDTTFTELSLTELETTAGGQGVGSRIWGATKVLGRWAGGPVVGAAVGAYDGYNDPSNRSTGDRVAGAIGGAFHGATYGVFRSTPAY